MADVTIYTDGASSGNPGPGGYGVVMESGAHRKELSAGFKRTTNNRMELLAVIAGLEALSGPGHTVRIISDSKYVVDAVEKRWILNWIKKDWKDVKNPDLWQRFLPLYQLHKPKFQWVKGHNGHPQNERCDALAVAAAQQPALPHDIGYMKSVGQAPERQG